MKKLLSLVFVLAFIPAVGRAQSSLSLNGVRIQSDGTNVIVPAIKVSSFSSGLCLQTSAGGLVTTTAGACGTSSGTVTVTGTPISGNIGFFSGGTSVTNGNLTGDVTTAGTNVTTVVGVHFGATGIQFGAAPTSGQCLVYNGTNITGTGCVAGTGTVTSVGLSLPSELSVTGSPITTSGVFTASWASEAQHAFLAGPSGASGTPSFRAIVASDIPTLNQNTTGTASNLSGTPALPNGTTATTQTLGDNTTQLATDAFVIANAGGTPSSLLFGATTLNLGTAPTSGQCLSYNGTNITGAACSGGGGTGTVTSVGLTVPSIFTASGSPVTGSGTLSFSLNSQAQGAFLGGPSASSGTPAFRTLQASDVPTLNQNTTGTAANLSGTPALPNGTTGTTQTVGDNTTKLATDAFVIANAAGGTATSMKFGATTIPLSSTAPTSNQCLSYDGTQITSASCSPGTSTPGGASTAIQFNSTGTFGGDAVNFNYNPTSHSLAVTGALSAQQIGHTFYAEDFTGATASAQIQACLNALTLNDVCIAKGLSGTALAQINVPSNAHLVMVGNALAFSGTGLSIGASTNVFIDGDSTQQITSSVNSAVSITTGSHIVIRNLVVNNYNTSNTTGNAGFFIFGAASDVVFEHDTAQNGNGQCFRMDSSSGMPSNVWIDRSSCISTAGASSEGIGPMGNNIWVTNNYIYKANVTGILVFNGRSGTWNSIIIKGNSIGDSSFSNGGNAAIQINPTSNGLKNIVIEGNSVWDDQGTPTTEVPISLTNGGSTGNITGLKISGNTWTNTIEQFEVSNSVASSHLIDSSWDETTIGAPTGVCATGSTDRNLTGGPNTTFYVCQASAWVSALGLPNTTTTVGTTAIAANSCTAPSTVTMTGLTATNTLNFTPTSDTSGVTGWGANGGLTLVAWPTTNTVNWKACNQTTASITPSASVTFNISAK